MNVDAVTGINQRRLGEAHGRAELAQGIQPLPPEGISLKQHLVNIERGLIEQALSRTEGNVSRTAKLLNLQRTTLIEKINKYELRTA